MTRVDFYVLTTQTDEALLQFACRLTDKAYGLKQQVLLNAQAEDQARRLDELLWTFKAGSFVPHSLVGAQADPCPVSIGSNVEPEEQPEWDVLINLAPEVPEFFSRYKRVAEVVDENGDRRASGRNRYRFYRERGYPIQTHKI